MKKVALSILALAMLAGCGTSPAATVPGSKSTAVSAMTLKVNKDVDSLKKLPEDRANNSKFIRVNNLAVDVLTEYKQQLKRYNENPDDNLEMLDSMRRMLGNGLVSIKDLLEGEQDPLAGQVTTIASEAIAAANKSMREYEDAFLKSNTKYWKAESSAIAAEQDALLRIYNLVHTGQDK